MRRPLVAPLIAILVLAVALTGAAGAQSPEPPAQAPGQPSQPAPKVQQPKGEEALDQLFGRLKSTKDDAEADVIEQAIWHYWINKGTDTVDILMAKGMRAMQAGDHDTAIEAFDAVLVLDPELAEGYNKRATVYYMMGRYADSVTDIEKTLELEPRHFGALSGLGLIYSELDEREAALRAFDAALGINPHLDGIAEKAAELRLRLEGRGI
ncbi:MAG: tetratricopeptide repeat protein [Acetobacterales bacterium]